MLLIPQLAKLIFLEVRIIVYKERNSTFHWIKPEALGMVYHIQTSHLLSITHYR
jgi:hypothetical protein